MLYKLFLSTLIAVALHLGLFCAMKFGYASDVHSMVAQQPMRVKIHPISPVPHRSKKVQPQIAAKRSPKPIASPIHTALRPVAIAQPEASPVPAPAVESVTEEIPIVSAAEYRTNPKPRYPTMSRRLGEEGRVILKVFLQADGHPGELLLHQSSGYERLDQSALSAVREWVFDPMQKNGAAVATWVLVPIVFKLNS